MAYQFNIHPAILDRFNRQLSTEEQNRIKAAGEAEYNRYIQAYTGNGSRPITQQEENSARQGASDFATRQAEGIWTDRSNRLAARSVAFADAANTYNRTHPNGDYSQEFLNEWKDVMGNSFDGLTVVNGVPTSKASLTEQQKNDQGVANGTLKKVQIGNGWGYIPTGSAADANQSNIGTNNTSTQANQNTPAPTTTSTNTTTGNQPTLVSNNTPKPTTKISGTLNQGSSGDQVKELQKWLADTQGAKNADGTPLKVDGLYGPQTILAVKQWQQQNGLTPDGIFGPKSLEAYTKINTGSTTNVSNNGGTTNTNSTTGTNTFNTGDSAQDELLQTLQDWIKTQQDAGLAINPNLNFDQATLDKFLETAKKQVHPYYQNQIDTIKQDVLREAPQILEQYQGDVADSEAKFKNSLGTARENYADSGLAFSGQRGAGELGMQSSQDRSLQQLTSGYGDKIYNLGRGAEEKIGMGNVDYTLPSLSKYSASLGGNGGFSLGGTNNPYSKGGYKIGSIEYDRESATEARRQALLKTAGESVVAGRSYNDLFN